MAYINWEIGFSFLIGISIVFYPIYYIIFASKPGSFVYRGVEEFCDINNLNIDNMMKFLRISRALRLMFFFLGIAMEISEVPRGIFIGAGLVILVAFVEFVYPIYLKHKQKKT